MWSVFGGMDQFNIRLLKFKEVVLEQYYKQKTSSLITATKNITLLVIGLFYILTL